MARLPVPQDAEIRRRLRQEQADPLIMYIVVNQNTELSWPELAQDVAKASMLCSANFRTDPLHKDLFEKWYAGSFRKVCLRAKAKKWEDVQDLSGVRVRDVFVLTPRYYSQREALLKKLQTMQTLETDADFTDFEMLDIGKMNLVVNLDLGMSLGKTLAQIGHAALMSPPQDEVVVFGTRNWEDIIDAYPVLAVKDGGLTEIAPGTETVLCVDPYGKTSTA